jgi:hypothetical protein
MRKTLGRPPTPKAKAYQPGLSVRLVPADARKIEDAIRVSGLTKSEWIREALLSAARRGK